MEHRPIRMRRTMLCRARRKGEVAAIARPHSCKSAAPGWKAKGTRHPFTADRLGPPHCDPLRNAQFVENRAVRDRLPSISWASLRYGTFSRRPSHGRVIPPSCPRAKHRNHDNYIVCYMLQWCKHQAKRGEGKSCPWLQCFLPIQSAGRIRLLATLVMMFSEFSAPLSFL